MGFNKLTLINKNTGIFFCSRMDYTRGKGNMPNIKKAGSSHLF